MIKISGMALQRGARQLFTDATATINPGERVALIGANGTGKSTLFALLRGALHSDAGDVDVPKTWTIAAVAQDTPAVTATALDYVLDGDPVLRAAQAEIAAAEAAGDGERIAHAHTRLADADGYTAVARAEILLHGLGFSTAQIAAPVASFSGGWRMRLNLAQALMCRSDLLLLDEPTNHLDLDAIVWLEDWLARYPGTLIVISHDRDFLDAVCTVTLHLDAQKLTRYGGNYSTFETLRAQQLALQQSAWAKQQQQIDHLTQFITRFKAKATKAKQAQSRVKALEKLELIAPVQLATGFSFEFREPAAAPNPLLVLDRVDCGYLTTSGPQTIVGGVTLSVTAGQRIALLGANGQGKSTLIKTLAGDLAPQAGTVTRGKGLVIGYFAQHQLETLRADDSPLAHLQRLAPDVREQELRDFLGSFRFAGEQATAPIAPLSGGEKARLALALIVWQKPNLLLLDEPTNHLDLDTREALTLALAQFDGTLIVVSHDRHLLRATTDTFVLVANGRAAPFDGDLDDYRDWLLAQASAQKAAAAAAAQAPAASGNGANNDNTNRKAQRQADAVARQQLAAQRKPIQKALDAVDAQLMALSARKAELDALLADSAIYDTDNKDRLSNALREQGAVAGELEEVEMRWLELQEALAALEN